MSGDSLYDRRGAGYAETRRADPGLAARLAAHLDLQPGQRVLDIACGTGNYTAALADLGARMTGVDVSQTMLEAARAAPGRSANGWVRAPADRLPFPAGRFEGAACVFGIHHFADLDAALSEAARVLAPGARFVILTTTPEQTSSFWLRHYWPDMIAAAARVPSRDQIKAGLQRAGFRLLALEPFEVPSDLKDLFLYAGRRRPHLYLDSRVRAGISAFALMKDDQAISDGLTRLEADIRSGHIQAVIEAADSPHGDYLWVVAVR